MDFFAVPTATFRVLYAFFVISHGRRKVLHFDATEHPTGGWIAQQLREAFPDDTAPHYLILDRDRKYEGEGTEVLQSLSSELVRISYRSPWQNGVAERWVGSCRELLDHTPETRPVEGREAGHCRVVAMPRVGGLLASKGKDTVDLEPFRTLLSSTATGSSGQPRLTNLVQLTLDTSWWTRNRSAAKNTDLDPTFTFPQAVPDLFSPGGFPAIPRSGGDLTPPAHISGDRQHGGIPLRDHRRRWQQPLPCDGAEGNPCGGLANPDQLRSHRDHALSNLVNKAGNAPPLTDPTNGLVFPDLNVDPFGGEGFQNLIMPEPCPFLSRKLPVVSIIRPTETKGIQLLDGHGALHRPIATLL